MSIESGSGLTHSDMGMARGGGIVRCRACSWAVVGLARLDCQYERTRSIVRGWGREEVENRGGAINPARQTRESNKTT
jgi:hypothetical protein